MTKRNQNKQPVDSIEQLKQLLNNIQNELQHFNQERYKRAREQSENLLKLLIADLDQLKQTYNLLSSKDAKNIVAAIRKVNFYFVEDIRQAVAALANSSINHSHENKEETKKYNAYLNQLKLYSKNKITKLLNEIDTAAYNYGAGVETQREIPAEAFEIENEFAPAYPEIIEKLAKLIWRQQFFAGVDEAELNRIKAMSSALYIHKVEFQQSVDDYLANIKTEQQKQFAKELLTLLVPEDIKYVRKTCKDLFDRYTAQRKKEAFDEGYKTEADLKHHYHGFFGKLLGIFHIGSNAFSKTNTTQKISQYIAADNWNVPLNLLPEEWHATEDHRVKGMIEYYKDIGIFENTQIFALKPVQSEMTNSEVLANFRMMR